MKNKIIICMIAILLIGCGLFSNITNQIPEDKKLSSGSSVVRMSKNSNVSQYADMYLNKAEINNFLNVNNYRYSTRFMQKRNVRLTDVEFNFWEDVLFSNDAYLQGICFTEKYLLVSSYYAEPNVLGRIMVFDKDTGEYILSLGLDSESHLGGIAFDGENIWVCNSSELVIERIPYKFVCSEAIQNKGKLIDIRMLVEKYAVNLIPSCITYYDDRLWIATHTKFSNSKMIAYLYDDEQDELWLKKVYHVPSKVQGIAFDEDGQVILSTSYGRKNSSYLRFYQSVEAMSRNIDQYEKAIEMPPCSEGIAIENQQIYLLFESAGEKYLEGTDGKGKCIAPLDKILIIDPA